MGESTKAVLAFVLIVGLISTPLAWYSDGPTTVTWAFRIGGPVVAIVSLWLILALHFRADLARDYLQELTGTYFNRGGFGFAFLVGAVEGVAYLDAYFINQHSRPCQGRIALRPARGFFLNRAKIDTITFQIDCGPGAYGYTRLPFPVPADLQGKAQSFEIGASVQYPEGRGKRLRFHDGVFLRANAKFGNTFGTAVLLAGAATGTIILSKPAIVKLQLPVNVADEIPFPDAPQVAVLWQLGDAPLPVISA
jgi:hypothetical protein